MFREMRRGKQEISREECIEILESAPDAVIAVSGDDGYPYTVPVNYVYNDGHVYIHCAKSGHKIDAIATCPKVSLCVVAKNEVLPQDLTTSYRSVIAFGQARVLDDSEQVACATRMLGLKYNPDREFVDAEIERATERLACIDIEIEHMTGKESLDLMKSRG